MDDALSKIAKLERELKEKEEILTLSAQIGKELLEQNGILNIKLDEAFNQNHAKCEKLEQEHYAINMKYQAKESTLISLSCEIEQLEVSSKLKVAEMHKIHLSDINKLNEKISSQAKQIDVLQEGKNSYINSINELQADLRTMKEKEHDTLIRDLTVSMTEDSSQQLQIISLINDKCALETKLKSTERKSKLMEQKISDLEESIKQTTQKLEYKECELTTQYNIIEKKKTEIIELEVQIENMNIEQFDPDKRGNSLFAELEDNRKLVERKYLLLKNNYNIMQMQYKLKNDQSNRFKMQIASLLSESANRGSLDYQEGLQHTVFSLNSQLQKMTLYCKTLKEENIKGCMCPCLQKDSTPDSILYSNCQLYRQKQKNIKKKDDEICDLLLSKAFLIDEIKELQRNMNMANNSKNNLTSEVIRLRVKLDECGVDLDTENCNLVISRRKERLPFYDEIQCKKQKEKEGTNKNLDNDDNKKPENEANKQPNVEVTNMQEVVQKESSSTTNEKIINSQERSNGKGMPIGEDTTAESSGCLLDNYPIITSEDKENFYTLIKQSDTNPLKIVTFGDSTVGNKEEGVGLILKDSNIHVKPKRRLKKMEAPHIYQNEKSESKCNQQ